MINKLLVDMDGTITTLNDYISIAHEIVKKVALEMGVDIQDWDSLKIYNVFMASDHDVNKKNMERIGLDFEKFWKRFAEEDYKKREKLYGNKIKLFDDVSVLREMAQNGFDMGILTDQPEAMTKRYIELFKLNFFKEIVCGCYANELSKPGTAGTELLMKKLGGNKENSVIIGDADIDIVTARKVGIPVIQIKREGEFDFKAPEPDIVIKTFHELPEAIKKLSK